MRVAFAYLGAAAIAATAITSSPPPSPARQAPSPIAARAAVEVLQKVCLPLLDGQSIKAVAASAGLKANGGHWMLPMPGRTRVELDPPDFANPHVCQATLIHRTGVQDAIRAAVNDWARAQAPALSPEKVRQQVKSLDYQIVTSTWRGPAAKGVIGVALSEEKTPDGRPLEGNLDRSELYASLTPN
jgi:hypothetical protein